MFGGGTLTTWAASRNAGAAKRILWGTGSTRHGETDPWPDPDGFALIGTREWTREREAAGLYVPCASCMSPLFDRKYARKYEAVRFVNADESIRRRYSIGAGDLPTMDNTEDFETVVGFLASARTVITNSFHGMYWATLLGCRVVCVPYSSKFYSQKFPPAYSKSGNDWRALENWFYPGALEDCRDANMRFYERVMDIVDES